MGEVARYWKSEHHYAITNQAQHLTESHGMLLAVGISNYYYGGVNEVRCASSRNYDRWRSLVRSTVKP